MFHLLVRLVEDGPSREQAIFLLQVLYLQDFQQVLCLGLHLGVDDYREFLICYAMQVLDCQHTLLPHPVGMHRYPRTSMELLYDDPRQILALLGSAADQAPLRSRQHPQDWLQPSISRVSFLIAELFVLLGLGVHGHGSEHTGPATNVSLAADCAMECAVV